MKKLKNSIFSLKEIKRLNNNQVRSKSVTSPSAPTASRCEIDSTSSSPSFCYDRDVLSRNDIPIVIKAVVELQYRFGLRISEVLSITCADVSAKGKIRIKALKGSVDRVIQPLDFRQFWLNGTPGLLPLCNTFSRFYFYREYRKLGWFGKFGSSSVTSVTHYFRHLQGLEIMNEWNDIELTARSLGHVSTNSTQYYVKKERK